MKERQTEAQKRSSSTDSRTSTEIDDILTEAENRVREVFSEYDNEKQSPVAQRRRPRRVTA